MHAMAMAGWNSDPRLAYVRCRLENQLYDRPRRQFCTYHNCVFIKYHIKMHVDAYMLDDVCVKLTGWGTRVSFATSTEKRAHAFHE